MKVTTFTKVLFASILAAALAVTASAGFTKKNTYNGSFSDVKADAWYAKEVASAYELGFVEGVSDTAFSPDTTVTVAQGITMASRVHAEYNGKTITGTGTNWYDVYVKYAKDNGIITENQFDSYTRELKRSEMAELFYDAMPAGYFNKINDVKYIPDVPLGAMYWDKLITLYNAGIVMGSDDYGSFKPDSSIVRSECAAIINRVAIPENRKTGELKDVLTKEAYLLAFIESMAGQKEGISSGWVLDNRGGTGRTTNTGYSPSIGDVSDKLPVAYIREFNYISSGVITAELNIASKAEGAFVEFRDIDQKSTYMLKVVNGKWSQFNKDGSYKAFAKADGTVMLKLVVDLDNGKSTTYINDVNYGEGALLSDNILSFRAGIDEKGTGSFTINDVLMTVNYAMYDDFSMFGTSSVYGWETAEGTTANLTTGELSVNNSKATKKFDAVNGVATLQNYFISKDGKDFTLNFGDAVKLESKGNKFLANGKEIYNLTQNMWYRLKIEADTNTGKAKVWLNGRVAGEVDMTSKNPVSSLAIETTGLVLFDNFKVYETLSHADYVPAPVQKASFDDYTVVMNICSLWQNGDHYGWACITPYDDHAPLIGYFDEGVPETADWEIKQMVDHGIDVQAFCWYGTSATGPMKEPNYSAQLHEGYMYAKYSDYMKYCIMLETSATTGFGSGQFRTNIVPYWFENYFLDDRYFTIDNKLVLCVFNAQALATDKYFGSVEATKKEWDYLENKAKEYGFDGMIYLASNAAGDAQLNELGFDGAYAYSWSHDGKNLTTNTTNITNWGNAKQMFGIPTVSVGFDSVPWLHTRYGLLPVGDYDKLLKWLTTEQLVKNKNTPDWAKDIVWVSTWNEYGEGTYITPSKFDKEGRGFGYGYLDVLRKYTTELPEKHEDLVPTVAQKARITHLYPQYARLLRREGWYVFENGLAVKKDIPENKLYINDIDIQGNSEEDFFLPPRKIDGKVYFPFNPSTSVNFILNCFYTWSKDAGTLEITANGHTVKFEVGSDMYLKDSKLEKLGYTVTMLDGVPYLDFVKLAKDLALKVEEKNGNVYIYSDNYESVFKEVSERKTGWWDFNGYDAEGWESAFFDITVADGAMTMKTKSNSTDPTAFFAKSTFPEDFYTDRYTHVELKARYKYNKVLDSIQLFFTTENDPNWNEAKSMKFTLEGNDTLGEWRTYTVDLSTVKAWSKGERLTGIRLDPFNTTGTMEFDYIHFVEDPNFVYVAPEVKEFAIENGDAEDPDVMKFYSAQTKISRIAEPGNEKNHVYYVKANPGNCYAYFRHNAEYEPGETYKIEFDIKLVGNNVNDPAADKTTFVCNLRYPDKTAQASIEHILKYGIDTNVNNVITMNDGWIHYEATHTIKNIDSNNGSQFTIYVNPANGIGFDYYLDNIKCEKMSAAEKAKADPASSFNWETAKGPLYTFDDGKNPFSLAMCKGSVENGVLVMKAVGVDVKAQLKNLNIDADKAVAVAVRYKAELDTVDLSKTKFSVFFDTKDEPGLSESKMCATQFTDFIDEGNGWYTVIVKMNFNQKWKGTVTTLRLDPADAMGTYYFDKVQIFEVTE